MYTNTDFSIPSSTGIYSDYNDTYLAAALGNNLNIPSSPHSPYSSGSSVSSLSLSPGSISPILLSPVSPTSSISPDSEGEDFPMDRLGDIKNQLNMFPPPLTAREFIEKNAFQGPDGHIKRPSNNFILFRKIAHDQKNQTQALSHYNEREWSQIIGKIWKSLSDDEMSTYKILGEQVAGVHKTLYPNYKYQPKRDKAAWKHYTVQNVTKPRTKKGKRQQRQQKQQTRERQEKPLEILTDFQQQQLIPSNPLTYSLPSETPIVSTTDIDTNIPTDGFSFGYTETVFDNIDNSNFSIEGLSWMSL